MRTGVIYRATNTITDKVYIGQTVQSLKERRRQHYKYAKKKKNVKFSNTLNKYDTSSFIWEIIESEIPIANLNAREIFFIEKFNSFYSGYNSDKGGTFRCSRTGSNVVLNNVKTLYNINTRKTIVTDAYTFIKTYKFQHPSSAYSFFKGKHLKFNGWIFLENKTLYLKEQKKLTDMTKARFTDSEIHRFLNLKSLDIFEGHRNKFINKYSLSSGSVSFLINHKIIKYRNWILITKEIDDAITVDNVVYLRELKNSKKYIGNVIWSKEKVMKEALRYMNAKEFSIQGKGAYAYAKKHKFTNKLKYKIK